MGAIRFYLAIVIAAFHAAFYMSWNGIGWDNRLLLGMEAHHAVYFFFIMSGFLISYTISRKYSGEGGTAQFFKARFLRVYPLWWALAAFSVVFLGAGFAAWTEARTPLQMLSVFSLFGLDWLIAFSNYPQLNFDVFPPGLLIAWTLGSEVAFYTLAPFLLPSRLAVLICLALSIGVRIAVILTVGDAPELQWSFFFFPAALAFFLAGHLTRVAHDRWGRHYPWGAWLLVPTILCLWFTPLRPFDTVQFYATALLFVIALPVVFDKTKDSKPLNLLGDITYPLYLIQGIVIGCIFGARMTPLVAKWFAAAKLLPPLQQSLVVMLPILFVIIVAAVITHYAVERPLESVFRRLISGLETKGWPWGRTASSSAQHRQAVLVPAGGDDARSLGLRSAKRDA